MLDDLCGVHAGGILEGDAQQVPFPRIHRRFLELRRQHFAQALEAADLHLAAARHFGAHQLLAVLLVTGVGDLGALRQLVERRHGQVEVTFVDELWHLAIEKCHQQRGDVGAVDVGVGHDDDLVVAQVLLAIGGTSAAAQRLDQVGKLLVACELVLRRRGDIEDLAAKRQDGLGFTVPRLLGRTAGRVALDDEEFGAIFLRGGTVGELAGQPKLADGRLARDVFFLTALDAFFGAFDDEVEQPVGLRRVPRQPMIEMVAHGVLDDAHRFHGCKLILGLALELRLADEDGEQCTRGCHHVVRRDDGGALVLRHVRIGADRFRQCGAQALLMGAALGRRDRVAVGRRETVIATEPGHSPFNGAMTSFLLDAAGKDLIRHAVLALEALGKEILQPAGEVKHGLLRRLLILDEGGIAGPADLDAAEKVGLGPRHLVEACRQEGGVALAEYLIVRKEGNLGAAPARDLAEVLDRAGGLAAPELLSVELLAAGHLDDHVHGQRVHDRDAHAVQAARRLVGTGVELAARVQRGHDDFEGGLVLELGMRIDGDAAAIVDHGKITVLGVAYVDPRGMARHRLVHGVVQHLGEEMVQRLLVGAPDIHAWAAADGLQPLQDFDVGSGVALFAAGPGRPLGTLRPGGGGKIIEEGVRGLGGLGHSCS